MKLYKLCALLAAVSLLLGIVLCLFGSALGGRLHDSFGVHYGENGPFAVGYQDFDDEDKQDMIELSPFRHLEIDIDLGDITIKRGNELKLFTEHLDSDDYELTQSGDTLKLVAHKENFHFLSINLSNPDYHYILTIPEDIKLESLTLESAMGDIVVDQINANDIDIIQSLGDVSFYDVECETMTVEQKMGDVEYEGKGQGNMKIDNSMGDITVKIRDNADFYSYDLSTSMGSIETDKEEKEGASQNIADHPRNAKYQLTMDCSMGDIELEFGNDFD